MKTQGVQIFNWNKIQEKYGSNPKTWPMDKVVSGLVNATNKFLDLAFFTPKKTVHNFTQFFTTGGNFPAPVLSTLEKYREVLYYDDAWEAAFKVLDFTSVPRNGFEVENVKSGITFQNVPEGGKVKVYGASGTKFSVSFDPYGGGVQWSRRLIDDLEYWTIDDNTVTFINKWWATRSQAVYDMIQAIPSSQNVAWSAPTPASLANSAENYAAIRDFNTINDAIISILESVKDKGYGVTEAVTFVILAPLQLKPRLDRALGILNGSISGAGFDGIRFNVSVRYTMSFTDKTKYYLALPGIQNYFVDRQRLTIFGQFDPLTYSDLAVGWGRFGGMIADIDQWRRLATA